MTTFPLGNKFFRSSGLVWPDLSRSHRQPRNLGRWRWTRSNWSTHLRQTFSVRPSTNWVSVQVCFYSTAAPVQTRWHASRRVCRLCRKRVPDGFPEADYIMFVKMLRLEDGIERQNSFPASTKRDKGKQHRPGSVIKVTLPVPPALFDKTIRTIPETW